ncbi:MAG: RNA polymerase sigma factor [Phycisphaerae bacterium]|nr:RNA polymerase sigma factor [Phycisphaerae bacterium]
MSDATPPQPTPVAALCIAASSGDADALEALLAMHHARMMGLARRKIGLEWRERIDAEDLLQEAYIDAFSHVAGFEARDEDSFYRWLARIVETRFLDHVRHWTRAKRDVSRVAGKGGTDSMYDAVLEQCRPDEKTPSSFLRKDEAVGALMSCIARLPEEQRAVVQACLIEQRSYEEVGAEIGKTGEAVRRQCARAIEKLRECLGRAALSLSRLGIS